MPPRRQLADALRLKGTGTLREIADPDPMAYNDPDQPPRIRIVERPISALGSEVTLAPCSVTVLGLNTE